MMAPYENIIPLAFPHMAQDPHFLTSAKRKMSYLHLGTLAVMELEGLLGLPGPASLTATTRNSYRLPSLSPVTLYWVLGVG